MTPALERSEGAPHVALVAGSVPQLQSEITTLLHRRIRFTSLLACAFSGIFLLKDLLFTWAGNERAFQDADDWALLGLHLLVVAVTAITGIITWRRPRLPLPTLRGLELALLGVAILFFGYLHYTWLIFNGDFQCKADCHDGDILLMAGDSCTLRWVILLIAYGVLIPNTWRRGVVVVTGLALCPLLLTLGVGVAQHLLPRFVDALMEMGLWIGTAAAVAIYGSHKISELRQQAFEARRLGQYRLKRRLGSGGMGEVYLAEHVLLKRPCAVKVIRPEQAGDWKTLARFEREVQATALLTHGNTVEVFDYGRAEDGTFYYAMEYLPGLNLQELVARFGPLPPGRVIHLLRQVCAALREAHGLGMVHRDLKPSNLIVCERGGVADVIKLLDFGLVRATKLTGKDDKLTLEGAVAGTPSFLSPEQARGGDNVDARSDLYSLGAVAYFLLTGRPPFQGGSPLDTILAHLSEAPAPLTSHRAEVPTDVQAVVLRCLEKAPARRFADAASLDHALAACGCAGQWTETQAVVWWREHPAS
jgi:serine/threonine-protein kinase